jgi:glycosyltransferase involved in cell wall biosynthesis
MSAERVAVLLAAYNGAGFIAEQLDSILAQRYPHVDIYIRDDGSSDGTPEIVASYQKEYPKRITVIKDDKGNLGVVGNFNELLSRVDAAYYMLSDQDDIWIPEKTDVLLDLMRRAERDEPGVPVLAHSDLMLVDEANRSIAQSFYRYESLRPDLWKDIDSIVFQNVVTGAAAMINRAARERAVPIPRHAPVHDWWLAGIAAGFGRIVYTSEVTVRYRQHGENIVGAQSALRSIFNRVRCPFQTMAKYYHIAVSLRRYGVRFSLARALVYKLFRTIKRILPGR